MIDSDLLAQFLVEAPELVQQAGEHLVALERNPDDRGALDGAFRAIHTLKGSAALFGFDPMTRVLHAAEDRLGRTRDEGHAVDRALIDAVLSVVNQIERWVAEVETAGAIAPGQDETVARLTRALSPERIDPGGAMPAPADEPWADALVRRADLRPALANTILIAVRYEPLKGCYFAGDDPLAIAASVPGIEALLLDAPVETALERYDPFACTLTIELLSSAPLEDVRAAFRFVPDQVRIASVRAPEPEPTVAAAFPSEKFARVSRSQIDLLSGLSEDLVVCRNALAELIAGSTDAVGASEGLKQKSAELGRLVDQLHEQIAIVRLSPVRPSFARFPRLVREIAAGLGKSVEMTVDAGDVSADRSVLDALFEPLLHVLRNAVDHGVEPAEERLRVGKAASGSIALSVRRTQSRMIVEVRDDGRGVDPDAVKRAAVERGLISQEAAAALGEEAAVALVFAPGFSTAAVVTDLSGRGVGMDAVRAAVARLGGEVSLVSRRGEGATATLSLPLTAMMVRLLVVSCANELYGIPFEKIVETIVVPGEAVTAIRAGRAIVLRDEAVPLVDLGELVGKRTRDWSGASHRAVVVDADGAKIAVAVDAVVNRMQTVVRPLSGLMSGMNGMLGMALLADGRVLVVLDLEDLIR